MKSKAELMNSTLFMNDYEKEEKRIDKEIVHFRSDLNFILSHNSWRPGKLHTFMGVASGGKSTLFRTISKDININNPIERIGALFSEESIDEVKVEISKIKDKRFNPGQIMAMSELDFDPSDPLSLSDLDQWIGDTGITIFTWDNITTSSLYEGRNAEHQFKLTKALKKILSRHQIPGILFAHTNSEINDNIPRLINMNDIRGGKGIVNLSEFFYILQRFEIDTHIFPTVKLTKFRGHDVTNRLYYLQYDKENFTYKGDHKLPWDEFSEAYKRRNVLK